MFDRVFQNHRVLVRHRNGPLAEERRRYLAYCAEQQMSPSRLQHIARYILVITEALRLAERPGELITQAEVDAEADRRVRERPKHRMLTFRFTGEAVRWLTFLGRLQVPAVVPSVFAEHIAEFADYLEQATSVELREVTLKQLIEFSLAVSRRAPQLTVPSVAIRTPPGDHNTKEGQELWNVQMVLTAHVYTPKMPVPP